MNLLTYIIQGKLQNSTNMIHNVRDMIQANIFIEHKVLEQEQLKIFDGHLYYLQFIKAVKLKSHEININQGNQRIFHLLNFKQQNLQSINQIASRKFIRV
ncbi:unnamed protein product [Paramecium sonneborni]|uniref:Uncharacterized protein n=1 Tax=Paramecium sonneborni TaxID=65129 RepID=A0A8S1RCN2_9CILI|nr:unnamed protein product [Paramecium sonneborni]